MSFTSTTQRQDYQGDGVTVTFAQPARGEIVSESAELQVWLRDETDADDPVETLQAITTDYTLSSDNVVMVTAPTADEKLILKWVMAETQTLDQQNNASFVPENQEQALDRIVAMVQYLQEQVDRCIKFYETEQWVATNGNPKLDPAGKESQVIGMNDLGDTLRWYTADELMDLVTGAHTFTTPFDADILDNQSSAVDLTDTRVDNADGWTSAWGVAQIYRFDGTSTYKMGMLHFYLYYKNGTWTYEAGPYYGDDTGVVLSVSSSGTIAQMQYASDSLGGGVNYVGTAITKFLRF